MNANIANGGVIVKFQGGIIFAEPDEWFLNSDEEYIYYSNRADENRLYRKRSAADKGKMLLNKPCAGVMLMYDRIYHVNESDKRVYRCSLDGKNSALCAETETTEFTVLPDGGVYVNPQARRVCADGATVFFADGGNDGNMFALTRLDTNSGKKDVFPDIKPSHINIHNANIYFTDRNRQNKIYKLDSAGMPVSVYGQSAEFLHVIDDWLYFLSDKKWRRLSLLNFGEAEDV